MAIAIAALTGSAAADTPLAPVKSLVNQVRFEDAAAALDRVFATGELSPDQVSTGYRLGAEIYAALGRTEAVATWCARWLSVAPKATLPAGASPKLREPCKAARARLAGTRGMKLAVNARRVDDHIRVRVVVRGDRLKLAAQVAIEYEARDGRRAIVKGRSGEPIRIGVPADVGVRYVAHAVDAAGNRLIARRSWAKPVRRRAPAAAPPIEAPAALTAVAPSVAAPSRGWYERWYPYAGVSVASLAVAGLFAREARATEDQLDAVIADSRNELFSDAKTLERRGERYALYSNIGFAAAAATAVTAVVMAARGTNEAIVATPTSDGANVSLGWSF